MDYWLGGVRWCVVSRCKLTVVVSRCFGMMTWRALGKMMGAISSLGVVGGEKDERDDEV